MGGGGGGCRRGEVTLIYGLISHHQGSSKSDLYMQLHHAKKRNREKHLHYGPLGLDSHLT